MGESSPDVDHQRRRVPAVGSGVNMFEIKKAERKHQPALIALWGGSSSGKTFSALRVARGLVGPKGKIGLIDTENRRALFYAGSVGGEWDHLDFQPPFTPEKYIEAFKAFENLGGYGCVIVDSGSHVWEGEGGVLDQADKIDPRKGLYRWAAPKSSYKRMMNTLLRAPFHVILCLRSKMGVAQVTVSGKREINSTGLTPIMEKNAIYEMTVSIALGPDHFPMYRDINDRFWVDPNIPRVKAPHPDILATIRPGEHLTEKLGEAIKTWVSGGSRDLPEEARRVAARGKDAFRGWWAGLTKGDRDGIRPLIGELDAIATQADAVAAAPPPHEDEATEVSDPFVDKAPPARPEGPAETAHQATSDQTTSDDDGNPF
ncbi:MAG: hypothetical protein HQL82_16005 [Magnetococcales bacterium]|nr:hypothetical protein [Magnetococcales bacterium]